MYTEKTERLMADFAAENNVNGNISYEELEEMMEQRAREEEADAIILADEKRVL